jgi:hypothetical protein
MESVNGEECSVHLINYEASNHNISLISSSTDCPSNTNTSTYKHLPIYIMKLAITSLLFVAFMSATVHTKQHFRLRAAEEPEAMITMSNQSYNNNNERELLSPWCDPSTPVKWHP